MDAPNVDSNIDDSSNDAYDKYKIFFDEGLALGSKYLKCSEWQNCITDQEKRQYIIWKKEEERNKEKISNYNMFKLAILKEMFENIYIYMSQSPLFILNITLLFCLRVKKLNIICSLSFVFIKHFNPVCIIVFYCI